MSILDLQRREMESGRIRFGNKKGNRPNRLDHPLLTSSDVDLLVAVAKAYDSEVQAWPGDPENQGQVEVHADLKILVPVSPEPCVQWWERWSGGGCMRRCDGVTDHINDAPCDCDKDADKRACSATSRIAVMLPETGDAKWRIESKSLYAALELPVALERATGEKTGEVIPGVLRVEQRRGKKGTVPVPVIELEKIDLYTQVKVSGDQDHQADVPVAAPGAGQQAQEPSVVEGRPEGSTRTITNNQIAGIMVAAKEQGLSENEVKAIVLQVAGVRSRKDIPLSDYPKVMAAITGSMVPDQPAREDV